MPYIEIQKTEYQVLKNKDNRPYAVVCFIQENNLLSVAVAVKDPNKNKRFDFRYGKSQAQKRAKHSMYFTKKNKSYLSPLAHTFDLGKDVSPEMLSTDTLAESILIVYEDDMPMLTFKFDDNV